MKNKECIITQDLLPLYIEGITSEETNDLLVRHLKTCPDCSEAYRKMNANIRVTTETAKPHKNTVWYLNGIKTWYLLCPLLAFTFEKFNLGRALYFYEGIMILFSLFCIASEVFHRDTWWDKECADLQKESRNDAKKKWGVFYTHPILLAMPSISIVIIMELPRLINFVLTYML